MHISFYRKFLWLRNKLFKKGEKQKKNIYQKKKQQFLFAIVIVVRLSYVSKCQRFGQGQ